MTRDTLRPLDFVPLPVAAYCSLCPWRAEGREEDVLAAQRQHREQAHGLTSSKRPARYRLQRGSGP